MATEMRKCFGLRNYGGLVMTCKIMKWMFGVVSLITLVSGIYNFEFWGGTTVVSITHILLSAASYLLWVIFCLMLVWQSSSPTETSKKISIALLVCLIAGVTTDQSPLTILFTSPFMGIARLAIQEINPLIFISILYLGIGILIWLECLVITRKRNGSTSLPD